MLRSRRLALTALTAVPLVLGALAALPTPAQAADTDVQINEFDSNGGFPDDWVELKNTGVAPVDISNWIVKDQTEGNNTTIPAATMLAPGALYTVDMSGLGNGDEVRVFNGATLVDNQPYAAHAANGTWSACPEGSNTFVDAPGTKGLPNACANLAAWPGGSGVVTVDNAAALGDNESGLAYEGTGTATPGSLWMVQNNPGTLRKLNKTGGVWTETTQWTLKYTGGLGNPDAEGVTIVNGSTNDGVYVATERDGSGGSLPMILRYAPPPGGGTISAVDQFSLAADLPGLGANAGPEAVAWVPDSYLTARGFKKDGGATYNPADFPGHGTGLFFVGVEQTGEVIGYALDHVADTATRVVTIPHFQSTVTDLVYDPAKQKLWAECDDNCGGRTSLLDVSTSGPTAGSFVVSAMYERPATAANLNNEGFTVTPDSECLGGVKPVFWADDGNTGTHALSAGTLNCGAPTINGSVTAGGPKSSAGWYAKPVTIAFACTSGGAPLVGGCPVPVTLSTSGANQSVTRSVTDADGRTASATVSDLDIDLVAPTAKIKGVKKGKTYAAKKKPKCKASDALSGLASCTVKQQKKGSKYKVTATATDQAGNVTVVTLTYKVKK